MELSVAIPVYNDAEGLASAVPSSLAALEKLGISFEIIIMEDGDAVFEGADERIRVNHSDARRGKGGALTEAVFDSAGEIFCFYDADLSTDLRHLPELLEKISGGADIAIGSRMIEGSDVKRSGDRETSSRGFNILARIFLGSRIRDHQCGFKAFRTDRLRELMPYVTSRGWTWDTEVLALAQECGYRIEEIPVVWKQGDSTNVRIPDYFRMGLDVLRLAWRIRVLKKYPKN
jgi:glycosyltransferase involved in cell wall biosynthesis